MVVYRSPVWVNSWDWSSSAWKRARKTPVSVSFNTPWRAFRSTRSVSWTPSMYWEAAWSKQFPSPVKTHRWDRETHTMLVCNRSLGISRLSGRLSHYLVSRLLHDPHMSASIHSLQTKISFCSAGVRITSLDLPEIHIQKTNIHLFCFSFLL